MNYNSGEFSCPQCGIKELDDCKIWLSKIEYENNSEKKKWIFYKAKNDCVCCLGCYVCGGEGSCYNSFRECLKCSPCNWQNYICFPFYFLILILYFIFCSIGDICNICCCKYLEYENVKGGHSYSSYSEEKYVLAKNDKELWNECKGFTGEDTSHHEFKCDNCGYKTSYFTGFIPGCSINVNNNTDMPFIDENQNIVVNIISPSINCSITCKLSDKFSFIENLFYNKNPEYRFKNCYFIARGFKLDPDLTLAAQGLQDGEKIMIYSREY